MSNFSIQNTIFLICSINVQFSAPWTPLENKSRFTFTSPAPKLQSPGRTWLRCTYPCKLVQSVGQCQQNSPCHCWSMVISLYSSLSHSLQLASGSPLLSYLLCHKPTQSDNTSKISHFSFQRKINDKTATFTSG